MSAAGDWDLFVYNPLGGASQPVTFSNLAMFIPETEENIRRYWIYETVRTFGSTGEWNAALTFLDFLDDWICLDGEKGTFTPHEEQDGRRAVITLTMSFAHTANDQPDFEDLPKTAVRIVADETSGQKSFSLLTSADGEPVWRDVRAQGAEESELNVPYTFNFVMDSTNRTFTAALVSGDAKIPLMDGDTGTFAFANRRQTPVESLELWGAGRLSSIYGSSEDAMLAFAEGDVLTLADGAATTNISAAQAAWLNSMAQYEMVRTKAGKMGVNAFADAWLMNLDLREERFGLGAFKVSKIEVTENDVRISVKLEREGAMQANAGGEAHDAAINGTLRLYGGATPGGLALLSETPMENEDFSSGDTALFVYPRGGEAKFFRPAIMPSAH